MLKDFFITENFVKCYYLVWNFNAFYCVIAMKNITRNETVIYYAKKTSSIKKKDTLLQCRMGYFAQKEEK